MKNILITGGAGFIGSSLAERLAKNPKYNILIVDNLLTGKIENIPQANNVTFINADVNNTVDMAEVFFKNEINYVFHYAAVVGVRRTLENPLFVLHDIEGFKNILSNCVEHSIERVFYASSSEVYGISKEFPQNEESTPLNARLPYSIVKSVGESYCESFKQEHNLDYTIFRFFNTYGPNQSPDFVVSRFIDKAIQNEPITIYGDGSQSRTFCFINDHLDACCNALENKQFVNDVVNIGNNKEYSILELAETIIELTNSSSELIFKPARKRGDMQRRQPCILKMNKLLNRKFTSLTEGLQQIIQLRSPERSIEN